MIKFSRYMKLPRTISKKVRFVIIFYTALILWSVIDYSYEPPRKPVNKLKRGIKVLEYTNKPIVVYWTEEKLYGRQNLQCKSDCEIYYGNFMLPPNSEGAYLFYGFETKFNNLPLPRNPSKVIWGLLHEESPIHLIEFSHEPVLNLFNYSSTFSRYSDIPCPLQFMVSLQNITNKQDFVETSQKNSYLNELSPILYIQSDCETATDRDKYVEKLSFYQRIDSYGKCLRNKDMPFGIKGNRMFYGIDLYDEKFLKFVARYKFVIAIENAVCEDYITEKFWRAIHVGVVPIYFGTPTIRDWLPNPKSAILIEDFPDVKDLSNHIDYLMTHDNKYEEYLEHKTKGIVTNENLLNEIRLRPNQTGEIRERAGDFVCYLCDKLYEKEKKSQVVTEKQYNCPKPISVLTGKVEEDNRWVPSWKFSKRYSYFFYDKIMKSLV